MYDQLLKAISKGFSANQIIDYIVKKFPKHSDKIKQALSAGFTADQVVRYLGGGKKLLNQMSNENSGRQEINTEFAKTQQQDIQEQQKRNKIAMGAGSAVLGAAALPLASSMASTALSRALPTSAQNLIPSILSKQQSNPVTSQPPIPPASSAGMANSIPQPQGIAQAINPQRDINKSIDIIKNLGQESSIKNMIEGGMTPKDIAGVLKVTMPKDKFKALEQQEGGIEGVIEDMKQSLQTPEQTPPEVVPQPEIEKEQLNEPETTIEPPRPIAKNSVVASPHGIGEVKEMRNGKALVEVEGKLHKINEEDLQPTEFNEDEIADAYDDLMAKIPEEHKSGFISWSGYDEDRNVLGFIPRGGKYEELHNITPEEAQKIKEGKGVARTTGETREGLWIMGEDTRGGVISQIIHDRRKKHKGEEEKQLKLGLDLPKREKEEKGMKPIFDEMAHARELSRERERKKKMEEKERKKKERDEAKKRKK
jgi:hypothetical protein